MHNIIILGGNSFLGKRLIADLSNLKINVVATTRSSISNINNDSDYIDWKTCDPVNKYQLASLVNNGDIVINLIYAGIPEDDLAIIRNIIDVSKKVQLKKFIHISTACLGEIQDTTIINEQSIYRPHSVYENKKMLLEKVLTSSHLSSKLIIIRPTVIFGPGGRNLRSFITRALNKQNLRNFLSIFLFGSRNMNLIPVKNVSFLIINSLNKLDNYPEIILSSNASEGLTIKDVINTIYQTIYGKNLLTISLPIQIGNFLLFLFAKRDPYSDKSFISLHKEFVEPPLRKDQMLTEVVRTIESFMDKN